MTTLAGPTVDRLLGRLRDPTGDRAVTRRLLTASQRLLNATQAYDLTTVTLTTEPWRQFYPLHDLLATVSTITRVTDAEGDLAWMPWPQVWGVHRRWVRQPGARFRAWSLLGRGLLILVPVRSVAATLTIEAATLTSDLTDDTVALTVPDEAVPPLLDLGEAIARLRYRTLEGYDAVVASLATRLRDGSLRGQG